MADEREAADAASAGTQEMKRRRRAVPPAIGRIPSPPGCFVAIVIYVFLLAALFLAKRSFVPIAFAIPVVLVLGGRLAWFVYGVVLLAAVRRNWSPRGVRCLLVFSNSPVWQTHIETMWLPRFGHVAETLNWSERALWRPTLAVRVFRRFCRGADFNPAVIVFRGLRRPMVFRFFYAFHQVKAGRPQYLQRLESDLLAALGVERS